MTTGSNIETTSKRGLLARGYIKLLWTARHEGRVLIAITLVALGIFAFAKIAGNVVEGDSQILDDKIVRAMRQSDDPTKPIGPHWLKIAGLDATALGGTTVLVFVTFAVSGFLLLERKSHAMWLVLAAVCGGQLMSSILKSAFSRPRPSVVPHLAEVQTSSFPSGHSMMSAVVYLTLGTLLSQFIAQRAARVYVFSLAVFLTVMVGVSRVYLGVHYPTDVLAGWSAGMAWALICWFVARTLQRRGTVEQAGAEPTAGPSVPERKVAG